MGDPRPLPGTARGGRRASASALSIAATTLALVVPSVALASVGAARMFARSMQRSMMARAVRLTGAEAMGPRDDMMEALKTARDQFNALELEAALATLDAAIVRAQGAGMGNDAALAPLQVLRGGIIYSTSGDTGRTSEAFAQAVAADYNVSLPIELRSEELQQLLDQARSGVTAPQSTVVHEPPKIYEGKDVTFEAVSSVPLQDGANLTLYYRPIGSEDEFKAVYMTLYGNLGTTTIPAAEVGDKGLEYFFYIYDAQNQPLGSVGNQQDPLKVEVSAEAAPEGTDGGGDEGGEDDDDGGDDGEDKPKKRKPRGKSKLPRGFINIGLGTGFGIARGTAEQTYQQYQPGTAGAIYSVREQACAVERWFVAGGDLAPDQPTFASHLATIEAQPGVAILPASASELQMAYDPSYCSARHPVTTGFASAPFHIEPEFGIRIGRAFVLSLFGRLQVVTGSKVYDADPSKDVAVSFTEDVLSPSPQGVRSKPPFTFAIGVKGKYFFGKDDKKLRFFAGGFAGYGKVRLRVDMGFSNDRNGNSVPDEGETALHGQPDANGNITPESCVPVWPYNDGCGAPDGGNSAGDQARALAEIVRNGTPSTDARIDTVAVGPGFAGLLFGAHYQIVKNFGLFGEIDIGGWFPNVGSVVFDLNIGPVITF